MRRGEVDSGQVTLHSHLSYYMVLKLRNNTVDVTRTYTSLSTVSTVSIVLLLPPLGVSPPLAHRMELQGWNASFSLSLLQRRPHELLCQLANIFLPRRHLPCLLLLRRRRPLSYLLCLLRRRCRHRMPLLRFQLLRLLPLLPLRPPRPCSC